MHSQGRKRCRQNAHRRCDFGCARLRRVIGSMTLRLIGQETRIQPIGLRTASDRINEQRFSPLAQIKWSSALWPFRGLFWTPGVTDDAGRWRPRRSCLDGVLYTRSSWSVVYAIDASTGTSTLDVPIPRSTASTRTVCCDVVNAGSRVSGKGYWNPRWSLIASIAQTGAPFWDIRDCRSEKAYPITGARGQLCEGEFSSEMTAVNLELRGYVSGMSGDGTKLAWRVYTVPSWKIPRRDSCRRR
jgi:hypothetical protein